MSSNKNPLVILTRKLWCYSKGNRHKIVLYTFLFLVANSIDFLYPLIFAKILNILQDQGLTSASFYHALLYLSLFIVLEIAFWIFWFPGRIIEQNNAFLVKAKYRKYLIDNVLNMPSEWHTNHHSGDTIDKIEKGTTALFRYSEDTFFVLEAMLRFIGSVIALAYFNLHSIYIVIFITAINISLILKFDKVLIKQYDRLNKTENSISAKIFDAISNISTIIILRIENLVSSSIYQKIMSPFRLFRKNKKIDETKWAVVSVINSTMVFMVIFTYLLSSLKNNSAIMIGTLSALYSYAQRITGLFFRFAWKYGELVRQSSAVANAELLEKDFSKYAKRTGRNLLGKGWRTIKISNLSFSYTSSRGKRHLEEVNITIKRKEKIALIGASGSGKTTFLKIVRGLYHPQYGFLYLDNKRLKNGFEDISRNIALIPQEPEIFATTIKENLTFGIKYPPEDIAKFIEIARFSEVIKRLPKGLNSSIVEKGVNLSGGEKQRLALARGLLASKNKEIILLDEPTSSVDPKNEYEIYCKIFREFKDKTIISSLHKLHLLPLFDKIYLFKNGKVIAHGSFNELTKNSAEFRSMWKKYMSKNRKIYK